MSTFPGVLLTRQVAVYNLPPVTRMVLPVRSGMSVSGLNFLPPNIMVYICVVLVHTIVWVGGKSPVFLEKCSTSKNGTMESTAAAAAA